MPDIQFSPKELSDLRMHYLNEKVRLEDALKHVEDMPVSYTHLRAPRD